MELQPFAIQSMNTALSVLCDCAALHPVEIFKKGVISNYQLLIPYYLYYDAQPESI